MVAQAAAEDLGPIDALAEFSRGVNAVREGLAEVLKVKQQLEGLIGRAQADQAATPISLAPLKEARALVDSILVEAKQMETMAKKRIPELQLAMQGDLGADIPRMTPGDMDRFRRNLGRLWEGVKATVKGRWIPRLDRVKAIADKLAPAIGSVFKETAVHAVKLLTAAVALRLVLPAAGKGLGNLLSTPGGLLIGALLIYLVVKR